MESQTIKQTGRAVANPILWLLEIIFKITSTLAAALTLGVKGSFFKKVAGGFASLPEAGSELYQTVGSSGYIAGLINDYNTMTAAAFNQKYGSGAVNYVMNYLNDGVGYLLSVYENLSSEPVSSLLAALLVFITLYITARLFRFIRQRGQGSYLDRMERRAGERLFQSSSPAEY